MLTFNILGSSRRGDGLCPTCAYAVMQKGFRGEELTSCSLGGGLRKLKFAVCECTAYSDRRITRPERVAGFVTPADPDQPDVKVIKIA